MTKNELLKRIVELGYYYEHDERWDKLRISPTGEPKAHYISIGNYDFKVHDGYLVSSERSKKLVRYILDYLDTPIEEREVMYYLRVPFTQVIQHYLGLVVEDNKYFLSCDLECSSDKYRKQFTQKEIDEMPFDTNFFVKEEVK